MFEVKLSIDDFLELMREEEVDEDENEVIKRIDRLVYSACSEFLNFYEYDNSKQ